MVETTQCIITTGLMIELIQRNINVIFCDGKHNPFSQLVGLNANYVSSKNLLKQIN
jgi:CRISPR/Cas system-associated endonuclease Cas1